MYFKGSSVKYFKLLCTINPEHSNIQSEQTLMVHLLTRLAVLLFMIYCLMYVPLFAWVLCWSLFWYAILLSSRFAIILTRKRELVALLLLYFWMSCYRKCHVALPHGVVGWSAVCDCGIS